VGWLVVRVAVRIAVEVVAVVEHVDGAGSGALLKKERIDSWSDLALEGAKYPGEAVGEVIEVSSASEVEGVEKHSYSSSEEAESEAEKRSCDSCSRRDAEVNVAEGLWAATRWY
jgi:hypothetical protein